LCIYTYIHTCLAARVHQAAGQRLLGEAGEDDGVHGADAVFVGWEIGLVSLID
jgi:hypothetical protein